MTPADPRFFVTGGALTLDAPSYLVRPADTELLASLRRGEYCCLLHARQMGKTSLVVRTAHHLRQEGCAVAFLDLATLGQGLNPDQWYYGLLYLLGQPLDLEDDLEDFWFGHSNFGPFQRWMTALTQVVLPALTERDEWRVASGEGTETPTLDSRLSTSDPDPRPPTLVTRHPSLVIFIDEIDGVRSLPFSTDEFWGGIRAAYNRRSEEPDLERLAFCLVGSALPSDLIQDRRTSPFNIGQRIELRDFTEDEVLPLAAGLDRPNAEALLKRAFYWTNGHPYLTQSLCAEIASDPSVQTPQDVDRVVDRLFFAAQARERNVNLADVAIRMLESPEEGQTAEEHRAAVLKVYGQVLAGVPLVDDEAHRPVAVLKLSGITRTAEGYLQVRNRIYERVFDREWVEENLPDPEVQRLRRTLREEERRRREADQAKQEAIQTLVQMHVATGLRLMDSGDSLQALLWFAEALRLDPEHEALHRMRFATALRQCPRLVQMWPDVAHMESPDPAAVFTRDGKRVITVHQGTAKEAASDTVQAWDSTTGQPVAPPVRHPGEVLALSPDGRRVFIALAEQKVQVREAVTSKPVSPPFPCRGNFKFATFSEDGRRVLRGSDENVVQVWDAQTGKPMISPLKNASITYWLGGAFSPDGRRVAITNGNSVQVWDLSTGKATPPLPQGADVIGTAFSSDGSQVVTFGWNEVVRVWDAGTGQPLRVLKADSPFVQDAAFSPDGGRLITGEGRAAQVWDLATGRKITPPLKGTEVSYVSFSPDGRYVLTAGGDPTARVWDAETGQPVTPPLPHKGAWGGAAWFSPEGRRVLTIGAASQDGKWVCSQTQLWDLATDDLATPPLLHRLMVTSAAFSPDGRSVVTASWDGTARVWDAATGRPTTPPLPHCAEVFSASFSPDGRSVVTASWDGTARVWDAATGRPTTPPLPHPAEVMSAEFSADGRYVVTASGYLWSGREKKGDARVWDAATGKLLHTLKQPSQPGGNWKVRFSPDGRRVAIAGGQYAGPGEARIWEVATGRPVTPPLAKEETSFDVPFSPDGRRVVTGNQVWDATTGQPLLLVPHEGSRVSFSPDGRRIATASYIGIARVLDAATGRPTTPPLPHHGPISSVEFSPDSRWVVTASLDQTARVWDAATGQPVTLPLLHHHGVEGASFSPDGQRVVTACDDGTAQVWEMSGVTRPAEELQRLAQVLSGYRLTASSGLQSLEPEEYSPAWKRLWRTSLGAPSASPVPGWVWHLRQAQECLKARQWAGALRHLSFLLPDYPGPGPLYAERARAYAELGQWEQARADYAQAVPQEGYDLLDGYRLALTQLRWGDVAGYRHTWKHLWERWEPTEDPSWAGLLVWTGALAPQPQADSDRLVTVAEKAVAGMPQNGDVLGILGSALYRAGRYDQAVQRGKEAQALHAAGKVGIGFLVPGFHEGQALRAVGEAGVDTLLQAMAYYRLGQGKEARCCLAQAEQQQSQRETLGDDPPWEVRVAYDLLHREAEELIGR